MSEQAARFSFIIPFKSLSAAFTFILYDTVLNIADELEYIWKGPRSWTKWAYAFIRHMPYLAQGGMTVLFAHMYSTHLWTQKQCVAWWIYQASVFEGLLIAVEGVFILRICAMYGYHRVLTSGILVLYFFEVAAMITVLAVATPVMQFNPECLIVKTPPIFATYWIVSLAFETFLFGLIIVKFFTSVSRQLGRRSILFVLVRDGMWAYAIIFVVMLLNTLMYNLLHNASADTALPWEISVISFAGSHVLLNLRRVSSEQASNMTSIWTAYNADDTLRFSDETMIAVSLNVETVTDACQYELQETRTDQHISSHVS